LSVFLHGLFDVGIGQNLAPETGDLMRVIDLHDVELLYDLAVYFDFPVLELWHDTFTQIDGNNVIKNCKGLNLFVGVLDIGDHLAGIVLVFE
jgi:hypothetical protein